MDVKAYKSWIDANAVEYALTESRLAATKARFMVVNEAESVRMLNMSYHNAVISQQTPVDRHEAGYVHWLHTGELTTTVNYANQKTQWLKATNELHKYNAARMLRRNDVHKAHEYMAEHFVGLGPMKAAFTIAMLGFESVLCIDTNVARLLGLKNRKVSSMSFEQYNDAMHMVVETFSDIDMTPFMLQWSLFDFARGTHSEHEVWFKSLNTFDTF